MTDATVDARGLHDRIFHGLTPEQILRMETLCVRLLGEHVLDICRRLAARRDAGDEKAVLTYAAWLAAVKSTVVYDLPEPLSKGTLAEIGLAMARNWWRGKGHARP